LILYSFALEAVVLTTSTKLSNLLQQMQMTGYMFKSAEYRMNFIRSLKGYPRLPAQSIINDQEVRWKPAYDCYYETTSTELI
jgi:hypothetical protein